SALNLYNLIASLPGHDLATAKDMIEDALNDGTNGFSASMRDAIEQIADGVNTTTDDLYSALRNNYLNRLAAFSIEGVFSDGTAVCEGISYAFMLLARIEGIECYQVTGYATNNGRV
ncbi:MAG TPA: hypothetical protein DIC18_01475, partial [Clostridiales bacterium]|nr:hypothetical protein [Clostridiales bacterium]